MFADLQLPAVDPFRGVVEAFFRDKRPHKVDLLLGMYRDEAGRTPTMAAIREAERRLADAQPSKGYMGIEGLDAFTSLILDMAIADRNVRARTVGIQSVGGTGGLRILCDLLNVSGGQKSLWISDPGYIGHLSVANAAKLKIRRFPYSAGMGVGVDLQAIFDALADAAAGDVIVLHACCHNPTGIDLDEAQWLRLAEFLERKGLIPLVDLAYQGLGSGLEQDCRQIEILAGQTSHVLLCISCSKTFGIYRERAGCAAIVAPPGAEVMRVREKMKEIAWSSYAVPPDHGAAVVHEVLSDDGLRPLWRSELDSMRERLQGLRETLADNLRGFISPHAEMNIRGGNGFFCLLPMTEDHMKYLRDEKAVYGFNDGRINLSCLNKDTIAYVVESVKAASQLRRMEAAHA